jgi:hypothetical protein
VNSFDAVMKSTKLMISSKSQINASTEAFCISYLLQRKTPVAPCTQTTPGLAELPTFWGYVLPPSLRLK